LKDGMYLAWVPLLIGGDVDKLDGIRDTSARAVERRGEKAWVIAVFEDRERSSFQQFAR
jgi:hypothetical protein